MRVQQRPFGGAHELREGAFGRPIDVADDSGRQRDQDRNLDNQGSDDGRPIDAAIIRTLVNW